jgi:hypothetical protein
MGSVGWNTKWRGPSPGATEMWAWWVMRPFS